MLCVCVCVRACVSNYDVSCVAVFRLCSIVSFKYCLRICYYCGPGIVTDYGLDGPGIESRWGEICRPSRPALGPTQPPVR